MQDVKASGSLTTGTSPAPYFEPADGALLSRGVDVLLRALRRLSRKQVMDGFVMTREPSMAQGPESRNKITEVYTQAELRRQIEGAAYDVRHAAAREQTMRKPIPVGRGPLADTTERLASLRRHLDLRIEQDAGREAIDQRATGIAAELLLVGGPLRAGAATPAVQKAVWLKLAEIATRQQAQQDTQRAMLAQVRLMVVA